MTHSTTYHRQAKRIEAQQALTQRTKEAIKTAQHYTAEDRKVAEQQEALEMFRDFLANEI
jgi:hypothetical protein